MNSDQFEHLADGTVVRVISSGKIYQTSVYGTPSRRIVRFTQLRYAKLYGPSRVLKPENIELVLSSAPVTAASGPISAGAEQPAPTDNGGGHLSKKCAYKDCTKIVTKYGDPGISLSRIDNKTLICSDCGAREAFGNVAPSLLVRTR